MQNIILEKYVEFFKTWKTVTHTITHKTSVSTSKKKKKYFPFIKIRV